MVHGRPIVTAGPGWARAGLPLPRGRAQRLRRPVEPPLLRADPGVRHRRRPGHARPVRPAPGHLRRLHRQRARAGLHRGLHPRRGAAALRQHPHRVQRHRAADDPAARGRPRDHPRRRRRRRRRPCVIFTGSGSTGAIDKLVGILGLRIPADLDDRYAAVARRSRATSGRSSSSGRSSTTPTSCRGASRSPTSSSSPRTPTATSTSTGSRAELDALRRPAAEDRLVLSAASNVTGIVTDTDAHLRRCCTEHGALAFWDFAAAGAVRRHRHEPGVRRAPAAVQGRDRSCRRTSSSAARARPGVLVVRRELLTNRGARRRRRRHRRLRQPRRARLPRRPGAPRGGRDARDRRVDPRRAGVPAQGRRRRRRRSARTRRTSSAARSPRGTTHPAIEVLGNTDGRAAVDRVVRRCAGRAGATCTTTSSSRCSTTCSASSRAAAARAPGRTATGCSASTSSARTSSSARSPHGCEGIKPGWVRVNFNYFITEAVFRYVVEAVALVADDGLAAAAGLPLRPAPPGCGGTATARSSRRCGWPRCATTPTAC